MKGWSQAIGIDPPPGGGNEIMSTGTTIQSVGSSTDDYTPARRLVSTTTQNYTYLYIGGSLRQMTRTTTVTAGSSTTTTTDTLYFSYDVNGVPLTLTQNGTKYNFVTNLQGDVVGLVNGSGTRVVSYTYDAWGELLTTTGDMASSLGEVNPIRYRGYCYDTETGFYYLQSRYYDPDVGRFINSDDASNLGVDGTILGYNLFTYCGNNPIMGYDPNGEWNWGGVIAGLGIVAATAITVATLGVGSGLGAVVAAAAITTGATMTYAAATDSAMVIDASVTYQKKPGAYGKIGISMIVDFSEDGGIYSYNHIGGGYGKSTGLSYSTGLVDNFKDPRDYAGDFIDVNVSKTVGVDHCYNPHKKYGNTTKATSISFTLGLDSELNFGAGYDRYSAPNVLLRW